MSPDNQSPTPAEGVARLRTDRPVSALPSVRSRVLAFAAILVAGLCGALIGYGFVGVQCKGQCTTPKGLGAVTGGALAAAGVAVVAVLTLRAMGEWKTITEERKRAGAGTAGPEPAAGVPSGPRGLIDDGPPPADPAT